MLVLGTPHLAEYDEWDAAALDPLLDVLERFEPDLIGVERLRPQIIEWMEQSRDKYGEVIEQFAKSIVEHGRTMQGKLSVSRAEAELIAEERLATISADTPPHERATLVGYLLAAYDTPSAILQWSYLPDQFRAHYQGIPSEVRNFLDKSLQSRNEVVSIGVSLAHRRNLQRIYAIDDHQDADLLLKVYDRFLSEMGSSKVLQALKAQFDAWVQRDRQRFKQAAQKGNLLPIYLYYNSPEYAKKDMDQWRVWFRTRFRSKLDRARVASWEVRNLNMASHIRRATAFHAGGRMVVIVGASHKPFLDAYLATMVDIRLVQLKDLL